MKIEQFQHCFKELCDSFDLDYEKKKGRIAAFYNSKLGELPEEKFSQVVKKAAETLEVKPGNLPPIKKLIDIYFSTATSRCNKPLGENFYDALCSICDNTGYITLWHDGYSYGGFCCTCIIGQNKQLNTTLGRKLGFYTDWLKKGYTMGDESLPKGVPF